MADKHKSRPKKNKPDNITSEGALRKIARIEANKARHEKNVRLADYFGVTDYKGSLSKEIRKRVANLKRNDPDRWMALDNGLAS